MKNMLAPLGLAALAGCATPPAAMEQANHTVVLMASLEAPLAAYRQTWSAIEQSRLRTLKTQQKWVAETDLSAERDRLAQAAAGDTQAEALRAKLLANADAVHEAKIKSADSRGSFEAKMDALLQPLPDTGASMTTAQAAAARLGTELPLETRAQELKAFVAEVDKGIQQNKKAIEDAKKAANTTASALPAPK